MNEQAKQSKEAKQVYRELVTINGKNVVLAHNEPPVINAGVLENGDIFRLINIFADKFSPTNLDKADGTPLRLYTSDRVKVDVSKRRKYDMGFWHRNIDAHEIIFCVKGALKWETEMGIKIMHEGDMLFIPKGIGHRSMLCEDSDRRQRADRAEDRRRSHVCGRGLEEVASPSARPHAEELAESRRLEARGRPILRDARFARPQDEGGGSRRASSCNPSTFSSPISAG